MRKETSTGLGALAVLLAFAAFSLFITSRWRPFAPQAVFETGFQNVRGLREGAWVRSQGMKIGTVIWIGRASDPADNRIRVRLQVLQREAMRLRQDAVARISSRGPLGDKLLVIDPGSGRARSRDDGWLLSIEDAAPEDSLDAVRRVTAKAQAVSSNAERLAEMANDESLRGDLASALQSWQEIRHAAESGSGFVHRARTDADIASNWVAALDSVDRLRSDTTQTADSVREVVAKVREGRGIMHELLYEDAGHDASRAVGEAATEIQIVVEGARLGIEFSSARRELDSIGENASATARDGLDLLFGIQSGKGTLGGLWVDTSLRDDFGSTSTTPERDRVFRALVRYSTRRDEAGDRRAPALRR